MAVVIPPGFALASYGGFITDDPEEMYVTLGLEVSASNALLVATELYQAWVDSMSPVYSTDFSLFSCTLRFPGPYVVRYEEAGNGGGATGTCAPPNVAVLITKVAASILGGRNGRFYHPAVERDAVSRAGALLDQLSWQGAADDWYASFAGVTDAPAPVVLRSDSSDPGIITSFQVQGKVATQRRRLR